MARPYRYYLLRSDGRAGQVINGVVTWLNNRKPLEFTPEGWQEIVASWERDIEKHGLQRSFTTPVHFVRDGAKIVRNVFINESLDTEILLLIQRLDLSLTATTYQWIYNYLYRGELDLTTYDDEEPRVTVSIMEGGLVKLLKANENTEYTIPFDEDSVNIRMDGIALTGKYNWLVAGRDSGSGTAYPYMALLTAEQQSAGGVAVFSVTDFAEISIDENATDYFLFSDIIPEGGTVHITTPQITLLSGGPRDILIDKFNVYTGATSTTTIGSGTGTIAPIAYDLPVTKGDRLFMAFNSYYEEFNFTVELKTKFPETIVKAFRPIDLFKKLIKNITGSADNALSTLLSSSSFFITCGDAIRGITTTGIKTSLTNFFKAFDVYHMGGHGIENGKIIFEKRSHFYDPSDQINLGEIKLPKIGSLGLQGSSIKVGHTEQQVDDVNGKYDFNGFMVFETPAKKNTRIIDLQSPYKAGPFEIELKRIQLDGKPTTDSINDNTIYAIDCDLTSAVTNVVATVSFVAALHSMIVPPGIGFAVGQRIRVTGSASNDGDYTILGVTNLFVFDIITLDRAPIDESDVSVQIEFLTGLFYNLDRSTIVTAGVPDVDTIFNVRLSPKRLLLTHGPWIRSWLRNQDSEKLVFTSANRNSDLVAGGIKESDDVIVQDLGDRIFELVSFEFETKVPIDLVDLLEANPNRCFEFIHPENGKTYKGFNLKSSIELNQKGAQSFQLLCAPGQDLSDLIY